MENSPWRPAREAEATSNCASFVEWLRATSRRPDASPEDVRAWRRAAPDAALAAIGDFAGLAHADAALLAAVAGHLLDAETRPGDVMTWRGDPDAPWPRAARLLGARVTVTPARADSGCADSDAPGTPPRS